jgi:predicted AlkP superfamily pyrophosphatase or phosphodiesterase
MAFSLAIMSLGQAARADEAPAPTPPKLLVAISIDQFGADLFAQYRPHFTGGLARLQQGAVYPSAFQSHAATETCPGHSTLLTGVHPSRSGVIANNWYDVTLARADKRVYCVEDEANPDSSSKQPVVSAGHLRVPTLGDRMKAAWAQSRNVAVSGKDRAAIMMGGHRLDAVYWWQGRGFTSLAGRTLEADALAENAMVLAAVAKGSAGLPVPAWCGARARVVKAGDVGLGNGRFALDADGFDQFRVSPRLDEATLDLAARLAGTMKLGKGPAPDMLSVSLSATDYVGHAFGHEGQEMCIQLARLDAALGVFLARLDALKVDYAVVLTADHGGLDVPERLDQQGLAGATRVDPGLLPGALGKRVAEQLGLPADKPVVYGDGAFGDYYVSRDLPADVRAKAIAALADILRAHPQVALALTREELARVPLPAGSPQDWSLRERARLSYDPERSGDVVSLLNRAVVPIATPGPGYTATHGSPWDYDRRVPLLFWQKGRAGFEQPAPVETVDIAPTLAALIRLPVPAGAFDGRCLDIDGGEVNSCSGK